jgi:FkbM family methyltransferase
MKVLTAMQTYCAKQLFTIRKCLRVMFPKLMLAQARSSIGRWSEVEEDLLSIVVDQARDAVDVGAYAGTYTLRLAKLARAVYAFEPDVQMAAMLRRAAHPNVRVSNSAVSDCEGTSEFHVPSPRGASVAACGSLLVPEGNSYEVRRVATISLDVALANSDVGFVKIDVEGAEQSVLLGARQLIARCRPVILAEANNPEAVATVSAFFQPLDYAGFFVYEGRTFGLHEYVADMQDPRQWDLSLPRRQMRFVNNLFFAPRDAEDRLRAEIDTFLASRVGAPND